MAMVVERPDSTYPARLKPYKLDLTQFGDKVRDEVTFKIMNVSDKELRPSLIACAERYFEVELPEVIKPGDQANAKVKLTKEALDMEFEKSFTISFDDAPQSRYTMPVKRKLRPGTDQAVKTDDPGN